MPLSTTQKQYIVKLDKQAKRILKNGGEEALLMSLGYKMNKIKGVIDSSSTVELDMYCKRYDGFYRYMNLLERLAEASSRGDFNDILNK